jgi:predicted dehydrogenase
MKKFFLFILVAVISWSLMSSCNNSSSSDQAKVAAEAFSAEPPRPAGQTDVVSLRCDPIPVVRAAFIGIGMRGYESLSRFLILEGVEVKAICDIEQQNIDRAQAALKQAGKPEAVAYTGVEDWKKVCERDDIDLVYITTHWDLHAPISIYAMEQGKHAVSEIPLAITMDECWQLVNTAERMRRHCIMMENTCYDFFEMATLNMAQQGLFGEIVHVEGAYIHDLRDGYTFRERTFNERNGRVNPSGYWNFWRLKQNTERNAALYPMHGLGPVAQILNINRGDKMDYLVALGSEQFNMTAYAKEKFGENSPQANQEYKKGDMSNVLIKTAKGKSILIQHDVVSPRPYTRHHTISGTKGFAQKYPIQQLAFEPNPHRALNSENMQELLAEYEHPITKEIGEMARRVGGHGGMDFIMVYRLVYCLQRGLPLDMNVYDGVSWSSVIPLSEYSLANGSVPVRVPDFTRGAWNKEQGLKFAK